MLQRSSLVLIVLGASLTWGPAALAQAPAPCGNADRIGCSYSATYGWVAGNVAPQDIVRDPKGQIPQVDAAAQAARDRQANDKMIADMAAQQQARATREAQASALMWGGTPGETPKQAYQRFAKACVQSNWRMGCGNYAALLYEHPEFFCEDEYVANPYGACSPDRMQAGLPAYNGCMSGDQYACEIRDKINAAGGAPSLGVSVAGGAQGSGLLEAYKQAYRECAETSGGKSGCGRFARLALDHPELQCQWEKELKVVNYLSYDPCMRNATGNAVSMSNSGCLNGDQSACALTQEAHDKYMSGQ